MSPDKYTINPVTVGKWEHVVLSYDKSGSLDAYINGTQKVDQEDVLIDNNTVDLSISTTINGKQPDGSVDEVKIYNHSISGDHAEFLYEEGRKALQNDAKNKTKLSNEETNRRSNYSVDVTPTSKETIGNTTKSNTVSIEEIVPPTTESAVLGSHLDPQDWEDLVGYWKFEGNASDSSGLGNDGMTRNGVKDTKGRVSDAYDFSSNGAVVQVSDDNSINPTEEITISFWLKNVSSFQNVIRKEQAYLVRSPSNSLSFGVWNNSGLKNFDDLSVSTKEGWNHYSFVFDGESYTGYRNGVEQDRVNLSPSTIYDSNDELGIGARGNDQGWGSIDGKLDEVMIFNTSLSSEKIEEIYNKTGGYKVDSASNLTATAQDITKGDVTFDWRRNGESIAIANLPFFEEVSTTSDGKVNDISTNNNQGTLGNGETSRKPQWIDNCITEGCYRFDGANDTITLDRDAFNQDSGFNLTVSAWVKTPSNFSCTNYPSNKAAVSYREGTPQWWIGCDGGTGKTRWSIRGSDGNIKEIVGNTSIDDGSWHMITGVYDAATKETKLFVDGFLENNQTLNITGNFTGQAPLCIGSYGSSCEGVAFWEGTIDDVRIYNRSISRSYIKSLYNEKIGSKNKIRSTSTFVNDETFIYQNISVSAVSGFKGSVSNASKTYNATIENYRVPRASRFDGKTNDFEQTNDLENVDVVLENTKHGVVNWSSSLNVKDRDFDSAVNISNNSISVDTSLLGDSYDNNANITFYNLTWNDPIVLKDGEVCSSCTETTYSNGDLTVQVSGFSTYTTTNGAPDCTGWWSNQTQPYKVGDVEDLQCMKEDIDANYTLTSDIDASQTKHWNDGDGFDPIGGDVGGTIDGNGNIIYELYTGFAGDRAGFIYNTTNTFEIYDIGFVDAEIDGGRVGGVIAGILRGNASRCFATGSVQTSTGNEYGGGLFGADTDGAGILRNCYADVNVTSNDRAAGISTRLRVENASKIYAKGEVQGNSVGGISDYDSDSSTSSFWDVNTSGTQNSYGGTGKTTDEMKHITTYNDTSTTRLQDAWNISTVETYDNQTWFMDNGRTYPRLWFEWEGQPLTFKINTTSSGNASDKSFTLPLVEQGDYNFEVSWGDGERNRISSEGDNDINHTYDKPGTYTVVIIGDIKGWSFRNDTNNAKKITEINRWGSLNIGDTKNQFEHTINLDIKANDTPILNETNSLNGAFKNSSVTGDNIVSWDVSGVENFSNFLSGTNVSLSTYSMLWEEWSQLNLETNVIFGGGTNRYNLTSMKYRQQVIDEFDWNISDGGPTLDPLAKGFNGDTTNFSNMNLSNTNVTLEKVGQGMIRWSNMLNATSRYYSKHVKITQDKIKVNVSNLGSEYDSQAEIRFYNLDLDDPVLLRDEKECDACKILRYTGDTLIADVPGFGTYKTTEAEEDDEPYYGYGSILDDEKDNISNTTNQTVKDIGLGKTGTLQFNNTYRINETGQNLMILKENNTLSLSLDDNRFEVKEGQNNLTVKDKRYNITLRNEGEDNVEVTIEENRDSKSTDNQEQERTETVEDRADSTSLYIWAIAILLLLIILYVTIKQVDSE